jgi:IS1 family transposase
MPWFRPALPPCLPLWKGPPPISSRWMRSIHSFKKAHRAVIWTAFSRRLNRVIAAHIGDKGVASALAIYGLAKAAVGRSGGRIAAIFTDANSCYRLAFTRHGPPEPPAETKAETYLIEAANSAIRDNLARLNRRSKRFSKSAEMLQITLELFINRHLFESPK